MSLCPHNPKETHPSVGMYHCPECGEMVIANMEHPDYSNIAELLNENNNISGGASLHHTKSSTTH